MKLHGNARTCPNSRRLLVERVIEEGWSVSAAAAAAGVSERTVYRWVRRWRQEGVEGLRDRSSRPLRSPGQLPAAESSGDPLAAPAAHDGSRDRRGALAGALDRLAVAEADRAGQAIAAGAARAAEPL